MPAIITGEDPLAKAIVEREGFLRSRRATWETLWQACQRYALPREAGFTEQVTPGHERQRHILDSTAPRSVELFASFLHTLMNNPSQQWFKIGIRGVDRPKVHHQKWMEQAERSLLHAMVRAKVYNHLHQVYLYLGTFGTAVLYVEMDQRGELRIRHYHLHDCVLDEGEDGEIDTVYRQQKRTARQLKQRWGDRAGKSVDDILKSPNPTEQIRIIHAVFPMNEPGIGELLPDDVRRIGSLTHGPQLDGAFASVWVNTKDVQTIHVGYYHEFPYAVPRWYQTADEIYGRSPAMAVLPDIRMANRLKETILRGAEKLADPPIMLPDGALLSPLRLFPGSITFTDGQIQPHPLLPPGASRIEVGHHLLEKTQLDIEKGFFVPFFVDIDDKVKTATQVLQEADERNRAVSPMLVRTQSELYDRFIPRTFNVLHRRGQIPEPPEDLQGELTVEYISPLAASQRQVDGLSILRMFEGLAPWHGIDDGVFDRFDVDEVAKVVHRATGAPAQILRGETSFKEVRQARRQRQEQEEMLAQIQAGAGAAADLMKASAAGK